MSRYTLEEFVQATRQQDKGQGVTPDVGAASASLIAGYLFVRWLGGGRWGQAIAMGLALGIALLTKFTTVVLVPIWLCAVIAYLLAYRPPIKAFLVQAVTGMGVALVVVNAGYGFGGTMKQLSSFEFVSPELGGAVEKGPDGYKSTPGNRFGDDLLGRVRVPLPTDYLAGGLLDIKTRDLSPC